MISRNRATYPSKKTIVINELFTQKYIFVSY